MRCNKSLRAGPFIIDSNAENEQVPDELEIETVEPSAPVVTEATVDQAGIVNDNYQIEFNEECPKEIIDLPPAYEDLFVKTEI